MATKRKLPAAEETSSCGAGAGSGTCVTTGCGFFGSTVTKNMCSKCFEEHVLASAIAEYSGVVATKNKAAAATTRDHTPFFAFARPEKKARTSATAVASSSTSTTDANNGGVAAATEKNTTTMMSVAVASSFLATAAAKTPSSLPATGSEKLAASAANRCARCRKKVGLSTGFKCRCGGTFCGGHRHYETHSCGFDYKRAGREQIAKQNPVVVADKMPVRI